MQIVIENDIEKKSKFNFKKNIDELIRFIPTEHLNRINKIIIIDNLTDKYMQNAAGLYYGYQDFNQINIVLCASKIFPKMPKFIFILFPIIPKLFLARTLYHEIGHHYQRMGHGYKKGQWEKVAEKYSKEMTKKVFFSSGIFKIIKLFKFILLPILRFHKNKREQRGDSRESSNKQ